MNINNNSEFRIPNSEFSNSISLLGSTGSIGRQTLEVADLLQLPVTALSANNNIALLEEQVRKYRPAIAAVYDEAVARDFKSRIQDMDTKVVSGMDGLIEAATAKGTHTVVTALVGTIGLLPTIAAIESGLRIALANKETLVCAGDIVMKLAKERNVEIIPVDSEHSALYQCLNGESLKSVKQLILTASGGPFRGMSRSQLMNITPEMALSHPVWKMGKKISIDSSTLMNKGLEVIEAMHLYSVSPEKISVVVHPDGIVHSMVEFMDNSVTAQLSVPDMRLPIQYALTKPGRFESLIGKLDLTSLPPLKFEKPDLEAFPCLDLALKAAKLPGTACTILNAANEAAVELFLNKKLSFYGIHEAIKNALENIKITKNPTLEEILETDKETKRYVIYNC